jgi:hypothetical protein
MKSAREPSSDRFWQLLLVPPVTVLGAGLTCVYAWSDFAGRGSIERPCTSDSSVGPPLRATTQHDGADGYSAAPISICLRGQMSAQR